MAKTVSKEAAIQFINGLREARREKSEAFEGYTADYSDYDGIDQYGFEYAGVRWESWHEASDPYGGEKALIALFDISEDELDD